MSKPVINKTEAERKALAFFNREQKAHLATFKRMARQALMRRLKTPAQVRAEFMKDKGIQIYLALHGQGPEGEVDAIIESGVVDANWNDKVVESVKTREQLANWWMEVYDPHNCPSQDIFSKMSHMNFKLFSHVRTSGYRPNVVQACLQLDFCQSHKPPLPDGCVLHERMVDELQVWLPLIKPITKKESEQFEGWKYVDIMEPSLSAYKSYHLYVREAYPDHEAVIVVGGYREEVRARGTLTEVIKKAIEMFKERERDEDE